MNVSIEKEFHKKIKIYAAEKGINISTAIENAIEFFIKNKSEKKEQL